MAITLHPFRLFSVRWATLSVCLWLASSGLAGAQALSGLALYEQYCGTCHSAPAQGSRVPDRVGLSQRTPEAILDAITTGPMTVNAVGLTPDQKRWVAEAIALRPLGSLASGAAAAMKNQCAATPLADLMQGSRWSGWSAEAGNTRFQSAAAANHSTCSPA